MTFAVFLFARKTLNVRVLTVREFIHVSFHMQANVRDVFENSKKLRATFRRFFTLSKRCGEHRRTNLLICQACHSWSCLCCC